MSGHSHWKKVKYKKGAADVKKGEAFSKLARLITVAAREGGADSSTNAKLRLAIEEAKRMNTPSENIERAIKRGVGELEGVKLESVLFEAYGPGGIALIIEGITDNKNRTFSEIKQILSVNSGKLGETGSVKWLFDRRGVIILSSKQPSEISREDLELKAIEAGAEDIYWYDGDLDVYTKTENLEKVKKNLEAQGIKVESTSLDWVAKENIQIIERDKEVAQKLFGALDENDAVQEIYSNLAI